MPLASGGPLPSVCHPIEDGPGVRVIAPTRVRIQRGVYQRFVTSTFLAPNYSYHCTLVGWVRYIIFIGRGYSKRQGIRRAGGVGSRGSQRQTPLLPGQVCDPVGGRCEPERRLKAYESPLGH